MSCDCDQILHGAVGVAKAVLGIDRASDDVIAARRDQCRNCEHATKDPRKADRPSKGLLWCSVCKQCNCVIGLKTTVAGEMCPEGKWDQAG